MKTKNIIFDFGGVLIDWNPRYVFQDMFHDDNEMEIFLDTICNSEWNIKQDAGRSFEEATTELANKYTQYENEIRAYYSNWPKMIKGVIKENVDLIEGLKDKYRLFGLTNWSNETFPIVFNQYSFFKEFEGIVVSGKEKLIKPDVRIYELILSRYGLKANESLFIDDNYNNIKVANKLGFKTIHLTETINLKDELKKLAI